MFACARTIVGHVWQCNEVSANSVRRAGRTGQEKAPVYEAFAEKLAVHAQMEEEIMYPAAILVGDVIRARTAQK